MIFSALLSKLKGRKVVTISHGFIFLVFLKSEISDSQYILGIAANVWRLFQPDLHSWTERRQAFWRILPEDHIRHFGGWKSTGMRSSRLESQVLPPGSEL